MNTLTRSMVVIGLFVGLLVPILGAQAQDHEGCKDHPLISRYPGSTLTDCLQKDFDQFNLPVGKNAEGKFLKTEPLEGKITAIQYEAPQGRSVLEVFRNYQSALSKAGFQTILSCVTHQPCWDDLMQVGALYNGGWEHWGYSDLHYVSAKLARRQGDAYVSLFVGNEPAEVLLYVVETKPMESGLITVNAAALQGGLAQVGHVEVPGIFFDFGKSDVKPESKPAFDEVAKMLKANPSMRVWVVGHTDNVGTLDANMKLSEARAASVAKALVTNYGINTARLKGCGAGPLAPVASNKTEEGRAKNRRVELVEQ